MHTDMYTDQTTQLTKKKGALCSDEQSKKPSGGGGDGKAPDDGGRGSGRHHRGDLPGEAQRKQGGERPHGAPRPLPGGGPRRRALVVAEAAEEQQQGGVGAHDEEDRAGVAVGAVDGEAGVDREEAEAGRGRPGRRRKAVAIIRHALAAAAAPSARRADGASEPVLPSGPE